MINPPRKRVKTTGNVGFALYKKGRYIGRFIDILTILHRNTCGKKEL